MVAPVLEWGFNEVSGPVVNLRGNAAYDFAIAGNTQRVGGMLTQSAAEIQAGPALTGLQTPARTMMVDAKAPGLDPSWFLEMHRAGTDDTGVWGFLYLGGSFRFRAKDSSNNVYERVLVADAANVHNFCVTHDGTVLKVYRDGVQVGADVSMPVAVWSADDFRIFDQSGSACFIDNVRYFTVALSPSEVVQWMNTPAGQNPAQPGGNVAESLADIQMRKLPAKVGFTASIPDMLRAFYKANAEAAVAAVPNLSTRDYERSMYINFTGASPLLSISDLEDRYYSTMVPGVTGTLSDREYVAWRDAI